MYSASSALRGLGVLSETSALIAYLVNGYLSGLKTRLPDQVNVYASPLLARIITDGVNAAIAIAAAGAANVVIPRDLLSELKRRLQNQYPSGDPYVDAFNYARQSSAERKNAIRNLNLLTDAIWVLTSELLAAWVPPRQSTGAAPGTTVNVDTASAQNTVDQIAAASGAVVTGKSFLDSYGIYVAAALLLLLFLDKGK